MLYGAPFVLNPPAVKPPEWKLTEVFGHILHNHTLLQMAEAGFHCAYFGLLFVDHFMGTKLYIWTALPLLIVTLVHLRGD